MSNVAETITVVKHPGVSQGVAVLLVNGEVAYAGRIKAIPDEIDVSVSKLLLNPEDWHSLNEYAERRKNTQ